MTNRQGQYTTEATFRVTGTVGTVDEALTWIVRQLDAHNLALPQGGFSPVTAYGPEPGEVECYYEVWASGSVTALEVTPEWP